MRLSSFNRVFCALLGIAVAAANSHSQVPERHLEADAEFPEGFSVVSGLREMPDGRLMVSDAIGQFVAFITSEQVTWRLLVGRARAGRSSRSRTGGL